MPTREEAIVELAAVFRLISEEYQDRKEPLPADTTEIVPRSNHSLTVAAPQNPF